MTTTKALNVNTGQKSLKGKDSKDQSFIKPEKKLKLSSYLAIALSYTALIYLSGGGVLAGLTGSMPILGINLVDYNWKKITNTPNIKLKNKQQKWIDYSTLAQVMLPLLSKLI